MLLQKNSNKENSLNLIEIFASVQGETSFTGIPTTFVRLAACNLRCSWCDTTYSFSKGTPYEIEVILSTIHDFGCKHICITGGEPLLQKNVHNLMRILCDQGYILSLETSGSLSTSEVDPRVHVILDIKCPGSQMSEKNLWSNLELLNKHDEVKFVVLDEADYLYAKEICLKYDLFKRVNHVLFAPVFGKLDSKVLVEWILRDKLPIRLNLQIHKFIWSPDTRGV
jgi:7-carboxy-7-deazaguanine synthase